MKFVKLIDRGIEEAPLNVEREDQWVCNYNSESNSEMLLTDGYKPFYEAEREPGHTYTIDYEELSDRINEVLTDITEEVHRQEKIKEIEDKIENLEKIALGELRLGNLSSVEAINKTIIGLEQTKGEL